MPKHYRITHRRLLYLLFLKYKGYYRTKRVQTTDGYWIKEDAWLICDKSGGCKEDSICHQVARDIIEILGEPGRHGRYKLDDTLAAIELVREGIRQS
jgi:hypothetical protein